MWSNVLGVAFTQNVTNTPIAGYTKMVYGDGTKLVGYSALDVGYGRHSCCIFRNER